MTQERDVFSMVPLYEDNVTAVATRGCYNSAGWRELAFPHWVFKTDIDYAMYEVTEKQPEAPDFPYLCVLAFKTDYSLN